MLSRITRSATGLFSTSPSGRINEYRISEKTTAPADIVVPPETTTIPEEPSPTVVNHSLEEELIVEPVPQPAAEPTATDLVPAPEPEVKATPEPASRTEEVPTTAPVEPIPTASPSTMQVAPEKSEKLAPVDLAPAPRHDVTPYVDAKHIPYPPVEDTRSDSPTSHSSGLTNPNA
ncbi:hypothetical protein FRB90_005533, partial [Tulasnella sp. 427]